MGNEEDEEPAVVAEPSCLKFPFPPLLSPEHPSGTATPPLQSLASVPFRWEELPGKPRPCSDIIVLPEPAKFLEPPPCTRILSPTTVLDGPYNLGRRKFSSFRMFREKQRSFDSSSGGGSPRSSVDAVVGKKKSGGLKMFGSFRRGADDGGGFGFLSSSSFAGFDDCEFEKGKKMMRRNGSFSSSSFNQSAATPLWVSMYESVKQAMPWKRTRKTKKEGLH